MLQQPNILIIDDEPPLIKALAKAFKHEGYALSFAENGLIGLQQLRASTPDLVFLDLRMPVMDGFTFLDQLKISADDPYLVIVITGHGDDNDVERCFRKGVNFFLRKPLSLIEVQCLARRCLEMKHNERELKKHRDQLQLMVAERTREINDQLVLQQRLIDSIPAPVYYKSSDGVFLGCNNAYEQAVGLGREDIRGRTIFDIAPTDIARKERQRDRHVLKSGGVKSYETSASYDDGSHHDLILNMARFHDANGSIAGTVGTMLDITARKQAELKLEARSQELEGANIALRVLLKQASEAKEEMEDKILDNIKELILPHLDKLTESLQPESAQYSRVNIIRENMKKITSSFTKTLSSRYLGLSPREIQVANLVRQGKSNIEAARLLDISKNAVEFHRNNIRKKLGLKNKRVNLRSYLLSMH